MTDDIEIRNDHTDEVLDALAEQIAIGLETIGLAAEGYAKRLCPVDTGRLRNSITYATRTEHSTGEDPAEPSDYETHGTAEKNAVYIGTNVEYAVYVEMGTVKTPAQPYLKPAVADHLDKYRSILNNALQGR